MGPGRAGRRHRLGRRAAPPVPLPVLRRSRRGGAAGHRPRPAIRRRRHRARPGALGLRRAAGATGPLPGEPPRRGGRHRGCGLGLAAPMVQGDPGLSLARFVGATAPRRIRGASREILMGTWFKRLRESLRTRATAPGASDSPAGPRRPAEIEEQGNTVWWCRACGAAAAGSIDENRRTCRACGAKEEPWAEPMECPRCHARWYPGADEQFVECVRCHIAEWSGVSPAPLGLPPFGAARGAPPESSTSIDDAVRTLACRCVEHKQFGVGYVKACDPRYVTVAFDVVDEGTSNSKCFAREDAPNRLAKPRVHSAECSNRSEAPRALAFLSTSEPPSNGLARSGRILQQVPERKMPGQRGRCICDGNIKVEAGEGVDRVKHSCRLDRDLAEHYLDYVQGVEPECTARARHLSNYHPVHHGKIDSYWRACEQAFFAIRGGERNHNEVDWAYNRPSRQLFDVMLDAMRTRGIVR